MVLSGIWKRQDSSKEPVPPSVMVRHDREISPHALQDLCASVGWNKRDPELIRQALLHSLAVVSAWDDGALVGFARATGDRVFNATIWDVAVRPSYQNKGIGRLVMKEILQELDEFDIPLVTLFADPGRDGFYREFGFSADPAGVLGMFREKA